MATYKTAKVYINDEIVGMIWEVVPGTIEKHIKSMTRDAQNVHVKYGEYERTSGSPE